MGVSEDIKNALRRDLHLKALPPPACSGATVSWKDRVVKPLCKRCGWEEICTSDISPVTGRVLISEDVTECAWFENAATMNKSCERGYFEERKKPSRKRWKPVVNYTWWGR